MGMSLRKVTERRLMMQGFSCHRNSGIAATAKWLRFAPALSVSCILLGTVLASPAILWLFAFVSAVSSVSKYHLFDRLYNNWLRRYTHSAPLPINPRPRRFSMLLAALWSVLTGFLFILGFSIAGYISGLLLATAGMLVATTHFCLGAWMYRIWERYRVGQTY